MPVRLLEKWSESDDNKYFDFFATWKTKYDNTEKVTYSRDELYHVQRGVNLPPVSKAVEKKWHGLREINRKLVQV